MENMSDIKYRIRSIGQTRQITKAMHLISIAKVKKALSRYEANATYFQKVRSTLKDILVHTHDIHHPFLEHRPGGRAAYIVITGDKGLAGGYNHNVLQKAVQHMDEKEEKYIFTVGQIGREFFARRNYMVDVEFLHIAQNPSLFNARAIAYDIIELYKEHLMDEVFVVYTRMISTMHQEPQVIKLLPVETSDFEDVSLETTYRGDILYEPSPKAVFDLLIPQYVVGLLYATLVQSFASEHSARMRAMDSATRNADKMISDLRMDYNRARQAAITQEIAEIMGGTGALEWLEKEKRVRL